MGERKLDDDYQPRPRGRGRGGLYSVPPHSSAPAPTPAPEPRKSAIDRGEQEWGQRPSVIQGGKQEDTGNIGQTITDRKTAFNPTAGNLETKEEAGTPVEGTDQTVPDQETQTPPPAEEFVNNTKEPTKVKKGLFARIRKPGPTMATGGVLTGTLIGAIIMAPITLLVNLSTLFFNSNDVGNHLFTKTGQSYLGSILKGQGRNCVTSKIKCKFTTISDKQLKEYEERKIKVVSEKTMFGRNKVRGLVMPDGKEITTIREYKAMQFTDPVNYNLMKRWSVRSYLAEHGPFKRMFAKYGLNKANNVKPDTSPDSEEQRKKTNAAVDQHTDAKTGDSKAAIAKKMRESADKDSRFKTRANSSISKLRSATKSMDPATLATLTACATETLVRSTSATVLALWQKEVIKFTAVFAQAGSAVRDGGNLPPELSENLSDRIMKSTTKGDAKDIEWEGKNGMDPPAMQMALHGDTAALKGHINDYSGWAPVAAIRGQGVVRELEQAIPGGRTSMRVACKAAAVIAWAGLIGCAGPQFLLCIGKTAAQVVALNVVLELTRAAEKLSEVLAEPAMDAMAEAGLNSSLYGYPLGQALGSGFGMMAIWKDRAAGFPVAGSETEALTFHKTIEKDMQEEQLADAKFEASKNQFDPYNPYSFMGRVASIFNPYIPNDDTLYSRFANIFATSFSVFGVPSYNAYAAKEGIFQPIQIYSRSGAVKGSMEVCKDPYKAEINMPCSGESGKTMTYMDPIILKCLEEEETDPTLICFEKAVDYLESKGMLEKGGSGKPVDWDKYEAGNPDKDYDNPILSYWQACTVDNPFEIGYTTKAYDADNMDWHLGARCGNLDENGDRVTADKKEDLAWMSLYVHDCIGILATEDSEKSPLCWEDTPVVASAAPGIPCTQGWVNPAPTATYTSGFGPRWGTQHNGIDLAAPIGTPIRAACEGEVIDAGPASGFGLWVVIRHDINGKQVDTVYGHNDTNTVNKGDKVTVGQQIGTIGNRGDSSGPHVHVEMWEGGRFNGGTPVDPAQAFGLGAPQG